MNKKGQTLILFVVMLPIFLLLLALVVDTGIILKENTKLKSTTKTIIKTTYEKRTEEDFEKTILDLMQKNSIPIENIKIEVTEDAIFVQNEYEKESIFGNIIGIKNYKIKCALKGHLENEHLKIEKE